MRSSDRRFACNLFANLLDEEDYLARLFGEGQSPLGRWIYRRILPLAKGKISRAYQLDDSQWVDRAASIVSETLDWVAERSGATGYLVGDCFTCADLTAAALLAPCCNPPGTSMERPVPMPGPVAAWVGMLADHPGIAWVLGIYARHRPSRDGGFSNPSGV